MSIQIVKSINERENRIEYGFANFPYIDGNDLIAKIFREEYQMISDEKIDGFWYTITKLHRGSTEYDLIWHEDVGIYMFSVKQDEESILELEQRLDFVVRKLNEMIKND